MSGELVAAFDALGGGGVAFTPRGLTIEDPGISFEHYRRVGVALGRLGDCVRFAAGDWMNAGLALFGDDAYDAFDDLGLSEERLSQYRSVAETIPPSRRRIGAVPWSLHRLVKNLDPADQEHWLAVAAEYRFTYREFEDQLRGAGLIQTRVSGKALEAAGRAQPAESTARSGEVVGGREGGTESAADLCPTCGQLLPGQLGLVEVTPVPKRKEPSWA